LLVCHWLHFVGQNHFYVMMFIIQGCCFIRSLHFGFELQRRLCAEFKVVSSVPLQPSGQRVILSRRRELSVRTFLCVKKLRTVPSYIRTDVSTARPDAVLCSISYWIFFFQKHRYGKIATTVRTRLFISKSCIQNSDVRTLVFMVRTFKLHIWKLNAADQLSGRQLLWSRR